jgi:HAD superfamily 5'-nucleotidase-like hydrolase
MMEAMHKNMYLKIGGYDSIGFDLDNTVCEYNITPLVNMEYKVLSKYLVEKKGYDSSYLFQPFGEDGMDFVQRGLIMDFIRGNVIKVSEDGVILSASHGTTQMSEEEIKKVYRKEKRWDVTDQYCKDMLAAWNGPLTKRLRCTLDYFDMPASLCFARAIDSILQKGQNLENNTVGLDVLSGLMYLYKREHFRSEESEFFKELKANPHKYYRKCSPKVIEWLKLVKQSKFTFLITGSNVDYATFTANYCLGENWQDLFDFIVCFARKPGFFTEERPFLQLHGFEEGEALPESELDNAKICSQGNWSHLYNLIARKTKLQSPKCLYIGDNLVQDIYTPGSWAKFDTLAVVEELQAENSYHPDKSCITSKRWGSFLKDDNTNDLTIWGGIIKNFSNICVPSLSTLADLQLDLDLSDSELIKMREVVGYYPFSPLA